MALTFGRQRLWTWLFLMSLLSVIDIVLTPSVNRSFGWELCTVLFVPALKASIVCAIVSGIGLSKWLRWLSVTIVVVYSLLSVTNFVGFLIYKVGVGYDLFLLLLETNLHEVTGFISNLISNLWVIAGNPLVWIIAIFCIAAIWFSSYVPARWFRAICLSLTFCGGVGYIMMLYNGDTSRASHSLIQRTYISLFNIKKDCDAIAEMKDLDRPFPDADKVMSAHAAQTVVMVLGESASREKFSIYGYGLKTSPRLDSMRDSLYILNDAIGSSVSTIGNLERILTFKGDNTASGDWYKYPTIIGLMENAGYTTHWISCQPRARMWAGCSTVISGQCETTDFFNNGAVITVGFHYDDVMLPCIEKYLSASGGRNFIFAHQHGSHFEYECNYPPSMEVFTKDAVQRFFRNKRLSDHVAGQLSYYCNTICFTDSILAEVIGMVSRRPEPAIFIYFSDHGESVFDYDNFQGHHIRTVGVPFIVYVNRAYREAHPEIIARLRAARDLPVSTANFIYSLMTLTGTTYPLYDPTRDFLSPEFKPRPRYVDGEVWPYEHPALTGNQ